MSQIKNLYKVDPSVPEEYKNFKLKRKYRWVIFGIDIDGETRTHVVKGTESDKSKTVDDLIDALPGHDCRYVVYEHEYQTGDGRKTDKLFFINWNPRAAATQVQMDYLTGRPAVRDLCDGCFDVSASTGSDIKQGIIGDGHPGDESDEDQVNDDNDDWIDE